MGGKIGWTGAVGATYIGMARRHSVTLIVTVLHCTPLQEITAGEQLLNWGFAMDGKVRPVGALVSPLQPAAARRPAGDRPAAGGAVRQPGIGPVHRRGRRAGHRRGHCRGGGIGLGTLAVRRRTASAGRGR